MNYHNILHDDMRNGTGLRVTLFLSGCNHYCHNCQNPQTWDCSGGIEFDLAAKEEIFEQLEKDYIHGITFSGGDPLHQNNIDGVIKLCEEIKNNFPNKTIWIYTGYYWEEIFEPTFTYQSKEWSYDFLKHNEVRKQIIAMCDVLVDGRYVESLSDIKYHWAGSTNQSVIDVKKSLEIGEIVLWETNANTN